MDCDCKTHRAPARKAQASRGAKAAAGGANAAILLAGGSGSRMRGAVKDKVLEPLAGVPVLIHSLRAFIKSGSVAEVVFVCRDRAQEAAIRSAVKKFCPRAKIKFKFARGGRERQDSVLNGLNKVSDNSGLAFIHDGARPLVGSENIVRLRAAAEKCGAAVLAARVCDTIKRAPAAHAAEAAVKLKDLDRKRLWAMQTPQVFATRAITRAYEYVAKNSVRVTDDAAAAELSGTKVAIVENSFPNPKITVPQDIDFAEFLLKSKRVRIAK